MNPTEATEARTALDRLIREAAKVPHLEADLAHARNALRAAEEDRAALQDAWHRDAARCVRDLHDLATRIHAATEPRCPRCGNEVEWRCYGRHGSANCVRSSYATQDPQHPEIGDGTCEWKGSVIRLSDGSVGVIETEDLRELLEEGARFAERRSQPRTDALEGSLRARLEALDALAVKCCRDMGVEPGTFTAEEIVANAADNSLTRQHLESELGELKTIAYMLDLAEDATTSDMVDAIRELQREHRDTTESNHDRLVMLSNIATMLGLDPKTVGRGELLSALEKLRARAGVTS